MIGPVNAATPADYGTINISVYTTMIPVYDVYGSGVSQVVVSINGTMHITQSVPIEFVLSFDPQQVVASVVVNGTNVRVPVAVSSGRYASSFALDFSLPVNATSLNLIVTGSQSGNSFLWRYISDEPIVGLTINAPIDESYATFLTLPHGTVISGMFFQNGTQLATTAASLISNTGDAEEYSLAPFVGTVLVQSTWFVPGSIVIASLALVVFAFGSLSSFSFGRRWIREAFGGLASKFGDGRPGKGVSLASLIKAILARARNVFQPKKLLALFLLCAVLMVSLGAIVGPYPGVKAYVVAAPASANLIQKNLASFEKGVTVLTPSQDYSDFEVMSSVADFNIAVISNYPSLAISTISGFIVPGLANVPVIVMDKNTDPTFFNQVNATYGNRIIIVDNATNLSPIEKQEIAEQLASTARVNILGLDVSSESFKLILAVEAVLSFALIFLGWTFLGSTASESMLHSDLSQLATVVTSGIFVFIFSEIIYVTTSILLAFPLSLHAVISGAKDVTAVGYLGFGGGSTPRLAAGFLGAILGVGLTKGGPKLEKTDLAVISGIGLFLLADPLLLGQFTYQGLLLFFGNFTFGGAYLSSLSLKGFIYGVGSFLGGSVNNTYLMSAGKMLYFSGLVPLAYLRRMGRTTTSIVALLSALIIGDGGVRVGEMTPDKTIIAVVPGLFVGFAFLIIFLGLASLEKYVRGRNQ